MKGNASLGGEQLKAVAEESDSEILGRLFWTSVGGLLINEDTLSRYYRNLDIPMEYFPSEIKNKSAWKRATKEMETKETETMIVNGDEMAVVTEYMMRKMDRNERHLVKEVRREDKGRLEYKEIVSFEFDNEADTPRWKTLDVDYKVAKEKAEEFQSKYKKLKNHYTDKQIRYQLRKTFNDLNKILMRSTGGVYFVTEKHADLLIKFRKLLKKLNEHHGTTNFSSALYQVPVISTEDQKDMISEKLTEDTVEKASNLMEEIQDIIESDDDITAKRYQRIVEDIHDLEHRKKEYEDTLSMKLKTCEQQEKILKRKLNDLIPKVKGTTKSLDDF